MVSDKKHFYRIVAVLGFGSAFSMLGDSTVYAVLPLHITAAGITLAGAGILMGINRLVRLFSNTVSGYLFDFCDRRTIFIASLFTGAFSTLFFAFFTGFWPLFLARIVWGIAWSGISIGGTGILLAETDRGNRGKWIGLHHLFILAGSALGSVMGGFFSDLIGYRGAMGINGALSLASAVIVLFYLPEIKNAPPGRHALSDIKKRISGFCDKNLVLASLVLGLSRFVLSGFLAALLSIVTREKLSPWIVFAGVSTLTGLIGGMKTAVSMVSAPGAGMLSDRFRNRWSAVAISLLAGAVGLLMITFRSPAVVIAGLLLCSIPGSSILVLIRTLAGDIAGQESHGRAVGFVLTAGDLGSAVGPPFAFFLLPLLGIDTIFRLLSVLMLLSSILVVVYTGKSKKLLSST